MGGDDTVIPPTDTTSLYLLTSKGYTVLATGAVLAFADKALGVYD
jgi:hypothetical protein